jgi:transmembrane 9 superfamily protein 2/4
MAGDSSITLKLGEILRGDRITLSDYDLILGQNRQTQHICTVTVDERNVYWMQALIRQRYKIDWMVDNLPGASVSVSTDGLRKYYSAGFQLGFQEIDRETMESRYFIHNHVSLVVRLRLLPFRYGFESVITGFEAYPKSIQYGNWSMTSNATFEVKAPFELALTDNSSQTAGTAQLSIPYTYSIHYVQEDDDRIQWSNRWDLYRDEQEEPRLRVATVNAVIVFLITSFLSARLLRPTRRALVLNHVWRKAFGLQIPRSSPSKLDSVEAALKEDMTKWKLVHRDVFRVPQSGPLLAPLVGSGMQLVFVVSGMYFSGGIAFLESGHRDVFVSIAMALIVAGGAFSGYYSARLYKTFGGHLWRFNLLVTGILVPGLLFSTVFTINLFVWAQASSTAIPFGTLIALLVLLLGIQLPLVYLGGLYGHKIGPVWAHQFRPSSVPRPIPKQPWYLRKPQLILLAGIIPFQIILFEQAYAFNGLFHNRSVFHYAFGLSDLIHLMLFATIRHMAVTGTYLQLSFEVCSRLILLS